MKIRKKLIISPAITLFFILIVMVVVFSGINSQRGTIDTIFNKSFSRYKKSSDLYERILVLHADLYVLINWTASGGYTQSAIAGMISKQKSEMQYLEFEIDGYTKLPDLNPEEKKYLEKIKTLFSDYKTWAIQAMDMGASDISIANMLMSTTEEKMKVLKDSLVVFQGYEYSSGDQSYSDGVNNLNSIIVIIVVVFFILILTSVAISLVVSRFIIFPIDRLRNRLKDIAEGEGDLTGKIKITSNDEAGNLAEYFNRFSEKLKSMVVKLKEVGNKSRSIGSNLAANTGEVSATIEEISRTMTTLSGSIKELSKELEVSGKSVEAINQFIGKVVGVIEEQSTSVTESSAAINEMIANIQNIEKVTEEKKLLTDDLAALATNGETGMRKIVVSMDDIIKSTKIIFDIIKVINSVAAQTNLLAMNAAIEAAHAGQYGRGFSVVADEIRKLAENTATNSKNISKSLKEVNDKIRVTAEITKSSHSTIGSIIKGAHEISDSMTEMRDGLRELSVGSQEITVSLVHLNKITDEVRGSAGKMREGTQSIGDSMNRVAGISIESRNGMEQVSDGTNEILKAILLLADLSSQNEENINILEREIMRFKTE